MKTQPYPMTNEVAGGKMAAGVSLIGAIMSWLPHIEAVLRVGASAFAIFAGFVSIWPHVKKVFRKRKPKHRRSNYED